MYMPFFMNMAAEKHRNEKFGLGISPLTKCSC